MFLKERNRRQALGLAANFNNNNREDIMATTRIFEVEFYYVQEFDGVGDRSSPIKESKSVTSKNAEEAIGKVRAIMAKSSTYYDEDERRRIKVTNNNFDPINVSLLAEASREH